jgi:hypothetical protein
MRKLTNIMILKGRITKNEQRLVQIKNQMLAAANAPGHVPYASFKRWEKQTREIRKKINWLQGNLRRSLKKPAITYYEQN